MFYENLHEPVQSPSTGKHNIWSKKKFINLKRKAKDDVTTERLISLKVARACAEQELEMKKELHVETMKKIKLENRLLELEVGRQEKELVTEETHL